VAAAGTSDASAPPARSRLPWLLGVALVFAIVFALWQGQRADRLTADVARLEAELSVVGAELAAHRAHLARVRVGVDDLASRARALSDLANADPAAGASTEPEAAQAEEPQGAPEALEAPEAPESGDGAAAATDEPGVVDF